MNKEDHHTQSKNLIRKMGWAFGLTCVIFVAELIGGFLSNSLALLSDAGHMFADIFALGLSLAALYIAQIPASGRRTYGYHRTEVFAAVFNGISLVVISGIIIYEAYLRLRSPEPVKALAMFIVATLGLVINLLVALNLHGSARGNLNVKSAYLHVIGDMLASVGVIAGGLIMLITGNYVADPVISIFVAIIILRGAYGVIKEGANILLEGVPSQIDLDRLKSDIRQTAGVIDIHDLHVWTLSSANIMLSLHILVDCQTPHQGQAVLETLQSMLSSKYGINHTTIQVECECFECPLSNENTV